MTKKMVWGWNMDGQRRAVVAADSIAEVVRLSGDTRSRITTYGSETGNGVEVATAQANPGTVLVRAHGASFDAPFRDMAVPTREIQPDADAVAREQARQDRDLADAGLRRCACGAVYADPMISVPDEAYRDTAFPEWGQHVTTKRHETHEAKFEAAGQPVHRLPTATDGSTLEPGVIYRVTSTSTGSEPHFRIYRDAVVEDDDSLTLVFENADGRRFGIADARVVVERIDEPTVCLLGDEPTLQRSADGDR